MSSELNLRLPAVPLSVRQARHESRAFLEERGVESSAIELALAEAVSNAVVHGYRDTPGWVEIGIHVRVDAVDLVVRDHGVGPLPHPESPGARLGIVLMRSLASSFELDGQPGTGTTIRMQFALDPI